MPDLLDLLGKTSRTFALSIPPRASADFMISSPLMNSPYERVLPDYEGYRDRLKTTGA
jgi:hypothetical protein